MTRFPLQLLRTSIQRKITQLATKTHIMHGPAPAETVNPYIYNYVFV